MHLFDIQRRFMGGYAIVGGQLPLATGAAFAVSYRNSHEVVACQMGEGTTNNGAFMNRSISPKSINCLLSTSS